MYIPTGDAYQTWGGQALAGIISPVDAAASNLHSANRFAFANPAGITIQYSTNSGSSWTDYGASNENKKALVSNINSNFYIGKASGAGKNTTAHQLRVILNATNMGVYTRLQKLLIYINTNYATGCQVKIEKAMKGSESTFTTVGTYSLSGWSGWNSIPIGTAFGGGSTQTSNIAVLQLTFSVTGINSSQNSALTLINLVGIGDTYWTYPSQMSYDGHLYSYDVNQNMYIPGHIYLQGASESSSTASTTQLVFGTKDNNHVVISSNKNALVINPTLTSTEKQIVLYLNQASVFPSGITANVTGNLTGLASKATADANGANISTTYAKLAGNNTFSGKNIFTASNTYNTLDTQKFLIGNSSSAFAFGGDGIQCFAGTNSTTAKVMYLQYYGGNLQIGTGGCVTIASGGAITTSGHIKGNYIQGTWLQTTAATAVTSASKIAVIHTDDYIYYITPANLRQLLNNIENKAYNALAVCYQGGTTPTYYRITFPDSQDALWGMYNLEVLLRQAYGSGTGGKVLINAHHANNASSWSTLTASVEGNLTTDIKVYASGTKYLYIAGCSSWSTAAVLNLIVGDGATGVDLSNISIDIVTELPSGYQTATMYYSLNSSNYTSYTVTKTGSGASGTWGINITGSAGSVAWDNVSGKPGSNFVTYYNSNTAMTSTEVVNAESYIHTVGATGGNVTTTTKPSGMDNAWGIIHLHLHSGNHSMQLGFGGTTGNLYQRHAYNSATFGAWKTILDSSNYTNYTVKKDGTGASGSWGINITGDASALAYPAQLSDQAALDGFLTANTFKVGYWNGFTPTGLITNGIILSGGWTSTAYGFQIAIDDDPTYKIYLRQKSTNWSAWKMLPMADGTNASGTWGISITGSSASCTGNAATATKATQDANGATISSTYLKLSGGTLTGTLTLKRDSAPSLGTRVPLVEISYKNTDSTAWYGGSIIDVIGSGETGTNYNAYVRMGSPTGSTFISAGECGTSGIFAKIAPSTDEKLYLLSDTNIYFYAGCANDASSYTLAQTIEASKITAHVPLYGAVWNDYAEFRETKEKIEAGRVVVENGDDTLSLATERLMPGANIVSDTFGFAIGETDDAKTPLAVSGRALVYTYEDRDSYRAGDPVCSGPNGTISKMTREEVMMYPDRMIGTVSSIPNYETWGTGNVSVNKRIWIKVV